jgi:hypothetical protein
VPFDRLRTGEIREGKMGYKQVIRAMDGLYTEVKKSIETWRKVKKHSENVTKNHEK